jgi:hypothetical protein
LVAGRRGAEAPSSASQSGCHAHTGCWLGFSSRCSKCRRADPHNMEQPAGLPAYRAVAAAARLSLPSAGIIGSYSPDVDAACRLSEPPVVWPSMGGPAVPLCKGGGGGGGGRRLLLGAHCSQPGSPDRLSRATNTSSERRILGPPSTSAESCTEHCTPAPLIRSVSASATEPTARHETVYTPSVLKTPVASSAYELAWSPASAVNALLCPQREGSPPPETIPETRGSSEQTKYVFGSSMFTRDVSQPACRARSRSPSSSPPHSGGEVDPAPSLPRQLEPLASAAYRARHSAVARQPSSFRSLEREAAAIGARGRGEWARLPPDRPTHASSGWAHSKGDNNVTPQRRSQMVTSIVGFL